MFESTFKRKLVDNDRYFTALVVYIHRNPQEHGFVADFRDWPYSSYHAVSSDKPTRVRRDAVLDWFNGRDGFQELHLTEVDKAIIKPLIGDDFA